MKILLPYFSLQKLLPVLLLPGLLLLATCRKYEDDDYLLTFKSPKKRLLGKKVITEYTVNGADSLSFFTKKYGDFYIEFTDEKIGGYPLLRVYNKDNILLTNGQWEFVSERDDIDSFKLILGLHEDQYYSSIFLKIKKLTKTDFFLEETARRISASHPLTSNTYNIKLKMKSYNT